MAFIVSLQLAGEMNEQETSNAAKAYHVNPTINKEYMHLTECSLHHHTLQPYHRFTYFTLHHSATTDTHCPTDLSLPAE